MFGYKTINLNTQQQQRQQHAHNYAEAAAAALLLLPASNMGATFHLPFAICCGQHTRDTPTFNLQPEVWVCTLFDIPTLTTLISSSSPRTASPNWNSFGRA